MRERRRKEPKLNRPERMQLKTMISVLGLVLLFFLLAGSIWNRHGKGEGSGPKGENRQEESRSPAPHTPTVEVLHNVWIVENSGNHILLFHDGAEEQYENCSAAVEREQVADVVLTDGRVTDVHVKTEKINGAVLGVGEDAIEVAGYGVLKLAEDFKGYRIYNTLAMCTLKNLIIGYDFADFVMEDGKICAFLMAREERTDDIRVLIRTADFDANLHQKIVLSADTDFVVRYGGYDSPAEEIHSAGDEVIINHDSAYFDGGRVMVEPAVLTGRLRLKNVNRSQGIPAYRGRLELVEQEEGFAVINVVPLEEYLYSVVPSEMPASYPREALKAQAICARTYAYSHILHAAYPAYGAHVDDSTSYQVYNNVMEQESTTTAVKETYGSLLYTPDGEVAGTYYYSTSCGVGSSANVWKTEEAEAITYLRARAVNPVSRQEGQDIDRGEYLQEEEHFASFIRNVDPQDYESEEGWYRWTYRVRRIDAEHISEILQKRYRANPELVLTLQKKEYVSQEIAAFHKIYDIYVAARLPGGVADELVIETDSGTYKVISEHNIRCVLCDGETKVKKQNGSETVMANLLPSAFFIIETGKERGNVVGYTLTGGGFGHGVGMSQNAARHMAESGLNCEEILTFFYDGCEIRDRRGKG